MPQLNLSDEQLIELRQVGYVTGDNIHDIAAQHDCSVVTIRNAVSRHQAKYRHLDDIAPPVKIAKKQGKVNSSQRYEMYTAYRNIATDKERGLFVLAQMAIYGIGKSYVSRIVNGKTNMGDEE